LEVRIVWVRLSYALVVEKVLEAVRFFIHKMGAKENCCSSWHCRIDNIVAITSAAKNLYGNNFAAYSQSSMLISSGQSLQNLMIKASPILIGGRSLS